MTARDTHRQTYREVLAGLAAKTLTKIPALNGRVEKACKLVLQGDVALQVDGTALVNSLTDPTRNYQVTGTPGRCQCQDFERAPEHLCCHRLAVGFARRIDALLAPAAESVPEVYPMYTPLPEAPASANVRVSIDGHEVQWTLRGTSEAQVFDRLHALLQRADVRPVPKPAARSGNWQKRR